MIVPHAVADLQTVAAHYDELDAFYRRLWGTSLHHGYWITGKESPDEAVDNLTRLVAQRAALKPGAAVCDLGCGYGAVALVLSRQFGVKVTGLTVSERQYAHARTLANDSGRIEFYLRDALDSGLPGGSYDAVIAIESTEHIGAKTKLLTEVSRLLRPGGRCVVAAWLSRERPAAWERKYLLEPICVEGRLPNMASASEFRVMFADAGFREIEFVDLTRKVRRTWTICARRVTRHFLTDKTFRRRLSDRQFNNRVFAKTVFRIWLAYRTGAVGYGIFSASK